MLSIKNLTVSVGGRDIVRDFSFEFKKNKVYVMMGPNGSGKSTLAFAVMGNPAYHIKKGRIFFKNKDITQLSADKRANSGIFLSFQSPLSISGVNVFQFMKLAAGEKKEPLTLKRQLDEMAKELDLKPELLASPLNDGASGGEKKKLEVLQSAVLDRQLVIFDEIDTGVDVDALKIIAQFLKKNRNNKTYIIITHYNRILKYINPDRVLIINNGRLVEEGSYQLAERIETEGYKNIK